MRQMTAFVMVRHSGYYRFLANCAARASRIFAKSSPA
jgi:hypothetical protein